MATLNNYLKGNLLLQKGYHNTSVETNFNEIKFAEEIMSFTLQENMLNNDRIVWFINFDMGLHKRNIYKDRIDPKNDSIKSPTFEIQPRLFVSEVEFNFDSNESITRDKDNLYALTRNFKENALKKYGLPIFLFVQGLEILDIYLESNEIYYWLLNILEEFVGLKQAFFLIQKDSMKNSTKNLINTLVNCRVVIENYTKNQNQSEAYTTMILSKNSGFSYFENQKITITKDTKIKCRIEKVTKQVFETEKLKDEDFDKIFQASFKIGLNKKEKELKDRIDLPHLKAQNAENVWKDYLLEVKDDEDEYIDPEQDEDDDLDV